ncbi:ATP-binding protein [Brenneria populi subsp. brevivirga]|uniref:ATP-binding protein n=1 Tax=Brenneria populi TaxID=1505588 RepID=UPI002E18814D|nr:ATP-binding protein [Brenneria populi subsp. brevivirga]
MFKIIKNKKNFVNFLIYFLSLIFLFFITGLGFYEFYLKSVMNTDKMRLEMYKATLNSTIEQYYYLPYMMTMDQIVIAAVVNRHDSEKTHTLNMHLKKMKDLAKADALYVLDAEGLTIASSNWNDAGSYVGQNYSFRPYFIQAMEGELGKFYGIGSTTANPGFFLSWRIEHQGLLMGVMVVKISLKVLENVWSEGPDNILISDENGIVFLSSDKSWRMKVLQPLSVKVRMTLQETRQYFIQPLESVNIFTCFTTRYFMLINTSQDKSCYFPRYYSQKISIPEFNWTATLVSNLEGEYFSFAIVFFVVLSAYLILLVMIGYTRMKIRSQSFLKEANELLEIKVNSRTKELKMINQQLILEMHERIQAEKDLQNVRETLAESSKLAALGQMATEMAHEQNQPLAAIRALTDNARKMLEKGMYPQLDQNLKYIISLVERMTQLITELKVFACRHRVPKGHADVVKAIYKAVALLNHNLEKNNVVLRVNAPSTPLIAECDELGLEQVFSNLLINALDAMEDVATKRLDIHLKRVNARVLVTIKDSGPGFSHDVLERIFDPFFTTKRRGMGLGLAIVKEIICNSEGAIEAENHADGGAVFIISWPEKENIHEPVEG